MPSARQKPSPCPPLRGCDAAFHADLKRLAAARRFQALARSNSIRSRAPAWRSRAAGERPPNREDAFMIRMLMRGTALAALTLPFFAATASAQIAVSANDNKIALVDGVNTVPANPP